MYMAESFLFDLGGFLSDTFKFPLESSIIVATNVNCDNHINCTLSNLVVFSAFIMVHCIGICKFPLVR